jgi:hypothetical protein
LYWAGSKVVVPAIVSPLARGRVSKGPYGAGIGPGIAWINQVPEQRACGGF